MIKPFASNFTAPKKKEKNSNYPLTNEKCCAIIPEQMNIRRHSQAVRQRSAKPLSPVRFRVAPPEKNTSALQMCFFQRCVPLARNEICTLCVMFPSEVMCASRVDAERITSLCAKGAIHYASHIPYNAPLSFCVTKRKPIS